MTVTLNFPASLCHLSREDFILYFGAVYEHSQWIAEAAYDMGLTPAHHTLQGLSDLMKEVVENAGYHAQLMLLRKHPDLSGKLAQAGDLTDESRAEQASAQLDQCTPEEFALFTRLNEEYQQKFSFPFIIAVRNYNREQILSLFQQRIGHEPNDEFTEALNQVHSIAQLRLTTLAQL